MPADEFINKFIREHNLPLRDINLEDSKTIFQSCAAQAFSRSNVVNKIKFSFQDIPLSEMSLQLNLKRFFYLGIYRNKYDASQEDFTSFPINFFAIARAAEAVNELYQELSREIDLLGSPGHDFSYYMRNFALPHSDKSLLDRGNYALARSVNAFSTLILDKLQTLSSNPGIPVLFSTGAKGYKNFEAGAYKFIVG